jgi:hypothetical protein
MRRPNTANLYGWGKAAHGKKPKKMKQKTSTSDNINKIKPQPQTSLLQMEYALPSNVPSLNNISPPQN